jgi:hypothetical protein
MKPLTTWLLVPAALLGCACAGKSWTMPETRLPVADVLQLAELALAEELGHSIVKPTANPHMFYVRIGERPAPRDFLARLKPPPPFMLRPDPRRKPDDGTCLQVDVSNHGTGGNVDVSIVYAHSHPPTIVMEAQGVTYTYARQDGRWVRLKSGRWMT